MEADLQAAVAAREADRIRYAIILHLLSPALTIFSHGRMFSQSMNIASTVNTRRAELAMTQHQPSAAMIQNIHTDNMYS
jgi:hypothetical protein